MSSRSNVGSISTWGFDLNDEAHTSSAEGLTNSLAVGAQFDSVEDAAEWYKKHAKSVGFSVRKDEIRCDNKSGVTRFRSWVCSCEGYRTKKYLEKLDRVREPRGITRTGCGAALHVKFNQSAGKFVVTKFIDNHTHALAAPYDTQFLRSHRNVNDADFAQAHALRQVGVKTCQYMDYKSDQVGGFHNVGFMGKDLQNKLDRSRRPDFIDNDSEAALAYLAAKADSDSGVYYEYTLDEENRLRNLFWTDTVAKCDYDCFGDVLAFDATYRKNAYNLPLVALVGVNHHRRTTVFGFALLSLETVDSYTWLLQTFLSAMGNKKPKSIITDGDKAMSKAIKIVMVGCSHRLCCWHLERNAQANIKNLEFTTRFRQLMFNPLSVDEFEIQWLNLVSDMGLEQNEWVKKMYQKRGKWAEAYLKGTFFGAMRSTQRCESLNSYLCRFVQFKLKLYDFIRQIYRAMYCIRHKEAEDEFRSTHTTPVLTTHMLSIEKHASEVYTKRVFQWVRSEILSEAALIMLECAKTSIFNTYTITKFEYPHIKWKVVYEAHGFHIKCSCKMLESTGIPCSHIFHVMKIQQIFVLPANLIVGRWTKLAKMSIVKDVYATPPHIDKQLAEIAKFGSLATACSNMCLFASKNEHAYMEALEEIQRMTSRFEQMVANDDANQGKYCSTNSGIKLKEPCVVKTKGCPKPTKSERTKIRKCSLCQQRGHTKKTCVVSSSKTFGDTGGGSNTVQGSVSGAAFGCNVSTPSYWMPSTPTTFIDFTPENENIAGYGSCNVATTSQGFFFM